jgi:DNA-directed RNA polymerase subunit beta
LGITQDNHIKRQSFAKIGVSEKMPDLLAIQTHAFENFLQRRTPPLARKDLGLQTAFNNIFPIEDSHGNYKLEFKYYSLGEERYSISECIDRGVSYTVPLKVRLVLHVSEEGGEKGEYTAGIEQDIFFGNIPLMTNKGTFVINGAERIIVSQLQRSPGVFFDEGEHTNGKKIYTCRVIPFRGSWVDFVIDSKDVLNTIIDRRRKFPATILLRSIGYPTNEDILQLFGIGEKVKLSGSKKKYYGKTLAESLVDPETGEEILDVKDIVPVDDKILDICEKHKIEEILIFTTDNETEKNVFINTFRKDRSTFDEESALYYLYNNLRTGEPPNLDTARKFVERLFFSPKKYDLGRVGRYRINKKFNLDVPIEDKVLSREDFVKIITHIIEMKKGNMGGDDIDHLGNRRVRTIGEQLENQFNLSLTRMARTIRERMNLRESENLTPQNLVNSRIITSVLNTFFGTNQLSQFHDQTNPLAEITHKRRVSALGPGGLTRERAGFEVRDVHYTHYGRLCPIETPEGPNIGLISSLATFAHVNDLGFIETPYRKVEKREDGVYVTNHVEHLSADDEDRELIAQANTAVDKNGKLITDHVRARIKGEFPSVGPQEVNYMDVSPTQLVSVSAALIPFLEHDDANRALMGSNMQRQSVPLLKPERPFVATGMEVRVAKDSRSVLSSEKTGTVEEVDSKSITIRSSDKTEIELDENKGKIKYDLTKYRRSNQDTTVNQKPLVKKGDFVNEGDVLADGPSTQGGELALGRNVLVAYMPWQGYNFEDAIILSERMVREDVFTSVHIKEFELEVRDTKGGV